MEIADYKKTMYRGNDKNCLLTDNYDAKYYYQVFKNDIRGIWSSLKKLAINSFSMTNIFTSNLSPQESNELTAAIESALAILSNMNFITDIIFEPIKNWNTTD